MNDAEFQEFWQRTDEPTKSLLATLLEDKDDIFKAKVLNLVVRHGLTGDDPLFTILVATDQLQVMLEEAPAALELTLEKQKKLLNSAAEGAIAETQKHITASVREIINKTEALQLKRPSKVLVPGLALFSLVFCLGLISGVGASVSWSRLQSSGVKIATKEEAATLAWAESAEGQYARNLYQWNRAYLESGRCQQDLQKMGVNLQLGSSRITSGICALFVVPPSQRNYQ
jgi:hypothetical protein